MAYSFLGSGSSTSSPVSATFSGGETVFVLVCTDGSSSGASPTCSDGTNTYTLVATNAGASQNGYGSTALFKADNVTAGTFSIAGSIPSSGSFFGIIYLRYSGLATGAAQTSSTNNFVGSGSSSADNLTGATVTPTSQPALVLSYIGRNGSDTISAGTGLTQRVAFTNSGSVTEDIRVTSTAAVTATATVSGSNYGGSNSISAVFSETATSSGPAFQADAFQNDAFQTVGAGTISATLAVTDGTDVLSASATLAVTSTLAYTDGTDIFSFAGVIDAGAVTSTLSVTDGTDIYSLTGTANVTGTLSVTDGTDVYSLAGTLAVTSTLAKTDGTDIYSLAGVVDSGAVTGTLSVTDGTDLLSALGLISGKTRGGYGESPKRRKRFVVEKDGKLLFFENSLDAVAALNQQKAVAPIVVEPLTEEVIATELIQPAVIADQMRAVMLPPMDMLPSLVQARKALADIEARLEAEREAERDDEESLLLLIM